MQAKVSELEQKVAEQQRAMTVLLQDKANLESRVNIFVRVLQMRDEQIEQIRSGQRVSPCWSCFDRLSLTRLIRSCSLCHNLLQNISQQNLFRLQILATKDKDEVAESFKDDLTLTVREGQPLVLTPSQVKNMTLDDMVSIWKVRTAYCQAVQTVHGAYLHNIMSPSVNDCHLQIVIQSHAAM